MTDRERQEDEIEVLESIYDKDLVVASKWPSSGCLYISPSPVNEVFYMNITNIVDKKRIEKTIQLNYLSPIELYFKCPADYPSNSQPFFMLKCIWLSESSSSSICRELDSIWDNTRSEVLYDWAYFLKDCCSFLKLEKLNLISNVDESDIVHVPRLCDSEQSAVLKLREFKGKLRELNQNEKLLMNGAKCKKKKVRRARDLNAHSNIKLQDPLKVQVSQENRFCPKRDDIAETSSSLSAHSSSSQSNSSAIDLILSMISIYGVRRKTTCEDCDSRVISNFELTGSNNNSVIIQKMIDYNDVCVAKIFRSESHFCNVCFEQKQGSASIRLQPCGHIFCRDCVSQYLSTNIINGNYRHLSCLNIGCDTSFNAAQVRQHVDETVYKKYEKIAEKAAIEDDPNLLYCPRTVCQSVAKRCPELGLEICYCPKCSFYFCFYCKKTYHGVQPCQLLSEQKLKVIKEYLSGDTAHQTHLEKVYSKVQLRKWVDEYLTTTWIEKSSKPCPNCNVPIQKNDGCNKILCTSCNIPFCWLCDKCLNRIRPYDHFNDPQSPCYQKLFPFLENDNDNELEFEDEDLWEENFDILDYDYFYEYPNFD